VYLVMGLGCGGKALDPATGENQPSADARPHDSVKPIPESDGGRTRVDASPAPRDAAAPVDAAPLDVSAPIVDAAVVSIQVTPNANSCDLFNSVSFRATAKLSDGSERDVTSEAVWASSAPNVMITTGQSTAACLSRGTTTISATLGTLRGELQFQVLGAKITGYALSPSGFTRVGAHETFVLMATYDDGQDHDLTSYASFDSSNTKVFVFVDKLQADGEVVGLGSTQVTAKLAGTAVASVMIVASDIKLESIAITPAKIDVTFPDVGHLIATGTFADGSRADITRLAEWTSADQLYVNVSQGAVTPVDLGTQPVFAALDGVMGSADVTVLPGKPDSLETGGDLTIPKQFLVMATVLGFYPLGLLDMTSAVTWHSDDPSIASFDGPLNGALTGHKPGTTTYYATFGALKSDVRNVTITGDILIATYISGGTTAFLNVGDTVDIAVTGTFDDGSEFDLTLQATWTTGNVNIATVSDTPGTKGHVRAIATGATSLTATVGTVSSTMAVIVRAP
jgi:trimeric autotransporter adhesin